MVLINAAVAYAWVKIVHRVGPRARLKPKIRLLTTSVRMSKVEEEGETAPLLNGSGFKWHQ